MDSFFLPLVAAAIAEWGDKTQILAMLLAARFAKPLPLFLGIGAAAAINMGIASFGGRLLTTMIDPNAAMLFLALGFLFAGVGAFVPFRDPTTGLNWKIGTFATAFVAFLAVEIGDKTQFIAAGFGASGANWAFAAIGATLGVLLGAAPAIMMGTALREAVPLQLIRRIAGGLFLIVSSILAINALSLI
ncbi:TMEM165/GDT1 family protein [Parasphingopyxis marina]|uniref:GDT1 family protein n=1 Tax=Parasphingopyxis marina TaxID=2761622 RepID=A0A842HXY0_9SPHN|nr:TMEM165/GDT1 family protein [Parasphingopyxis marina]MBC2779038.1 TMEM165/GDT1 family protein [Parasphingopyxis marina]